MIARIQAVAGNGSYFDYDGLGSVCQLTDPSGAVAYTANYDPYGLPLEQYGAGTTNLGFTGEYTDQTGLQYLRARYYDPSSGTFIGHDPIWGIPGSSQSYSGYRDDKRYSVKGVVRVSVETVGIVDGLKQLPFWGCATRSHCTPDL